MALTGGIDYFQRNVEGANFTITDVGVIIAQRGDIVAIGNGASATLGTRSVCIGYNAQDNGGNYSTIVGPENVVTSEEGTVIGYGNAIATDHVVAIGAQLTYASGGDRGVMLGSILSTTGQFTINIGFINTIQTDTETIFVIGQNLQVGESWENCLVAGDHIDGSTATTVTFAVVLGQNIGLTTSNVQRAIAIGEAISNVLAYTINIGNGITNSGVSSVLIGSTLSNADESNIIIGASCSIAANTEYSIVQGTSITVGTNSSYATVLGSQLTLGNTVVHATLVGNLSSIAANSTDSIVVGYSNSVVATCVKSIVIGTGNSILHTSSPNNTLIGSVLQLGTSVGSTNNFNFIGGSNISVEGSVDQIVAIGYDQTVATTSHYAISLGASIAVATGCARLVAIGSDLVAGAVSINTVLIGNSTTIAGASSNNVIIGSTFTFPAIAPIIQSAIVGSAVTVSANCPRTNIFGEANTIRNDNSNSNTLIGNALDVGVNIASANMFNFLGGTSIAVDGAVDQSVDIGYDLGIATASHYIVVIGSSVDIATTCSKAIVIGHELILGAASPNTVLVGNSITLGGASTNSVIIGTALSFAAITPFANCIVLGNNAEVLSGSGYHILLSTGVAANTNSIGVNAIRAIMIATDQCVIGEECDDCINIGNSNVIGGVGLLGVNAGIVIGKDNIIADQANDSTVIGRANISNGILAVLIGFGNVINATSDSCQIIGNNSEIGVLSSWSTAIGESVAIGEGCTQAVALGQQSVVKTGSQLSTAIGSATSIGTNANNCVALGALATISNSAAHATALGSETSVTGFAGIAIGYRAVAPAHYCVIGDPSEDYEITNFQIMSDAAGPFFEAYSNITVGREGIDVGLKLWDGVSLYQVSAAATPPIGARLLYIL